MGFRYTITFAEGACRVIARREAHGGFGSSDDHPFYDRVLDAWRRLGADMVQALADVNEEVDCGSSYSNDPPPHGG